MFSKEIQKITKKKLYLIFIFTNFADPPCLCIQTYKKVIHIYIHMHFHKECHPLLNSIKPLHLRIDCHST